MSESQPTQPWSIWAVLAFLSGLACVFSWLLCAPFLPLPFTIIFGVATMVQFKNGTTNGGSLALAILAILIGIGANSPIIFGLVQAAFQ